MDYSSYQHQNFGYGPSQLPWFTLDPAASTYDEALFGEQQPQFTSNQHLVQPFDPPMDPFPVDYSSTLTPVAMDVAPDLDFPSASPPEGPAGERADPEDTHGVVWNVEGERLASDMKYEHGLHQKNRGTCYRAP
ncbi:hypothetical protein K525DRAFT_274743 [Schizophyllum commune Loenen D]|nr:hypothetical protein K525DRAFT_274743 [Schizophyllum commune Loenen D]